MVYIDSFLSNPQTLFEEIKLVKAGFNLINSQVDHYISFGRTDNFYFEQACKIPSQLFNYSVALYFLRHPIKGFEFRFK